ncbi:hypothetical protein PIB30_014098 [Stylosanthes scabra]|uniref:Ubiquitin-like protease family profile domain-containing protein n=1 Tax=Stylosanthes scabra TaxID=79078 RepID=A0ABU6S6Z1_9FABA|nr:hypothetical protein [Stylosanthes scabra]
MGRPKKSDAKRNEEDTSSSKNQGHLFRSLTTTVATMFEYLNENPDKLRLVNEMGFGALSHLPANNLDQQLLNEIYDRYDVRDNTIYSDAAAVKITTRKIGDVLGLCSKGTSYETRVVRKKLSQEDKDIHKFFQGKSAVALTELVQTTPLDTEENRKLFMRAFILFIQKAFLLPNSTSSIVPNALTRIFDLETTRKRNRALHVHDFLLQELKKAKQNNAAAIHDCIYGLLKTGQTMAKKSVSKRKSPPMRVPPSNRDSKLESEPYQPSADSEATESNLAADIEPEPDPEPEPEAEQIPQREIRSKWKNDRIVVASNAPVPQHNRVSLSADDDRLVDFVKRNKRRKSQRIANTHKKQKLDQINEGDGATSLVQPEQPSKSEVEAPPIVVEEEKEPEQQSEVEPDPINIEKLVHPEGQSGMATEDVAEHTELDPEPINIQTPLEPELTLKPWLDPEAETTVAKGTTDLAEEIITDVLLSMKKEDKGEEGNQDQQPGDQEQCNTTDAAPASMEERCFIWATTENNNKYDIIFQLRGPNTIEAMREQVQRFQREVYCVPPEILDQQFVDLLDNEKLRRSRVLFAPVLYLSHWWLYVLDVENREFFIVDSVFGVNHDQQRQKLHRFGAGATSLIKKGSNTLQLWPVDVLKQPNPTDCGVYVMKWLETLDTNRLSYAYTFKIRCMVEEWDKLDGFREEIVAKLLLSKHNTLNFESMNQSRTMTREAITEGRKKLGRRPKPSVALKSPFLNPSTAELENKH